MILHQEQVMSSKRPEFTQSYKGRYRVAFLHAWYESTPAFEITPFFRN
ncbi:MAG: hypothetical protein ACI97A_004478 [Planctomycetota bacterium]|jgi:hypothetical protein